METKVGREVESMDDDMDDILMRVEKYHDGGKKVSSASFAVATYKSNPDYDEIGILKIYLLIVITGSKINL